MANELDRRDFLSKTALAASAFALPSLAKAVVSEKKEAEKGTENTLSFIKKDGAKKLGIGFIGVGLRGQNHVSEIMLRDDCEVVAFADPDVRMMADALSEVKKAGRNAPKTFGNGPSDYQNLLKLPEVDAIIIATPWEFHTEQAVAAMRSGKATATEVCGAFSLDECWQLVNVQEQTGAPFMFLENVCYRRDVMAILNMVRQGLFGELMHLEGGYQHDLRHVKFNDGQNAYGGGVEFGEKGFSESKWRTKHSLHRNGELYPTHGIGPVAMMADINRGNRFLSVSSFSSKARGLHNYIVDHPKGGKDHPNAKLEWKLGDVVTTILRCANGETMLLSHDTSLPRPYSLAFRVQGTKGIWMDVNESLLLEGITKEHEWSPAKEFLDKYDHPLWKKYGKQAEGAGHGGMDFFVINAFIEAVKTGAPMPIDVYDGATWLAITPLSEMSIAAGGQPQAFPDFTRGRWTMRKNEFALNDTF